MAAGYSEKFSIGAVLVAWVSRAACRGNCPGRTSCRSCRRKTRCSSRQQRGCSRSRDSRPRPSGCRMQRAEAAASHHGRHRRGISRVGGLSLWGATLLEIVTSDRQERHGPGATCPVSHIMPCSRLPRSPSVIRTPQTAEIEYRGRGSNPHGAKPTGFQLTESVRPFHSSEDPPSDR